MVRHTKLTRGVWVALLFKTLHMFQLTHHPGEGESYSVGGTQRALMEKQEVAAPTGWKGKSSCRDQWAEPSHSDETWVRGFQWGFLIILNTQHS